MSAAETGDQEVSTSVQVVAPVNLRVVKSSNRKVVVINETLTYRIIVNNTNAFPIFDARLFDPIPRGTTFDPGSVTVNGIHVRDQTPETGIFIVELAPGAQAEIIFRVHVAFEPDPAILRNQARVQFVFLNQQDQTIAREAVSNVVVVEVEEHEE